MLLKEDIDFLKALQREMLTQDKVCQAAPRFWVVRGTVREYGIDYEYSDGEVLKIDFETTLETMQEVYDYLTEYYKELQIQYTSNDTIIYRNKEKEVELKDLYMIWDLFLEELGTEAKMIGYNSKNKIFENTMFLTLEGCKDHIKKNYYHYPEDAHPYAMTAWRSQEVERLWNIIEQTDWDSVDNPI